MPRIKVRGGGRWCPHEPKMEQIAVNVTLKHWEIIEMLRHDAGYVTISGSVRRALEVWELSEEGQSNKEKQLRRQGTS